MRVDHFGAVHAVREEVAVAIGKTAVDERDLGVRLSPGKAEVGRDPNLVKRGFDLAGIDHPALAHVAIPAPQLRRKRSIFSGIT